MPSTVHLRFDFEGSRFKIYAYRSEMRDLAVIDRGLDAGDKVKALCRDFRALASQRSFADEEDDVVVFSQLKRFGEQVFDLFFRGLEEILTDVDQLVLEHDLFFVPLEWAFDGREFLGLRCSVSNVLPRLRPFRSKSGARLPWLDYSKGPKQCLVYGREDFNVLAGTAGGSLARWNLAPLKTTALNRDWLRGADIIHFAGHGKTDREMSDDFFLATVDAEQLTRVSCTELEHSWQRPPELVFLNVCVADNLRDDYEGFLGVAGAFLKTGVNNCVATAWSIDDRAAVQFAREFYLNFLHGAEVSHALRSARLRCWDAGEKLTSLSYILFSATLTPAIPKSAAEPQSVDPVERPAEAKAKTVLICYAAKDRRWAERLKLAIEQRGSRVLLWDETSESSPLQAQALEILSSVSSVLLLVSPSFLASQWIASVEFPAILRQVAGRGTSVYWIVVSASLLSASEIDDTVPLNDPSRPLDSVDAANVDQEVDRIADRVARPAK